MASNSAQQFIDECLNTFCAEIGQQDNATGRATFRRAMNLLYACVRASAAARNITEKAAWESFKTQAANAAKVSEATIERWVNHQSCPHPLARESALRALTRAAKTLTDTLNPPPRQSL